MRKLPKRKTGVQTPAPSLALETTQTTLSEVLMDNDKCRIVRADMLGYLDRLEHESFDACVTDPPYELGFMGKSWDSAGVSFRPETWEKVYRVLKPGAHLLAFGGTRTIHRIVVAIEDAGFEIRDCLMWVYGQGFPKSLDVSKAIDKAAGAEREVVGEPRQRANNPNTSHAPMNASAGDVELITAPATDAARQWSG